MKKTTTRKSSAARKRAPSSKRASVKRKKSAFRKLLGDSHGSISAGKLKKTKFSNSNRLTQLVVIAVVVVGGLSIFAFSLASSSISLSITGVTSGGSVTSPVTIGATPKNVTPVSVAFYLDKKLVATDTSAPYCLHGSTGAVCNTDVLSNGSHTVEAVMISANTSGSKHHRKNTTITTTSTVQFKVVPPPSTTTGSGSTGSGSTGTGSTGSGSTGSGSTGTGSTGSGSTGSGSTGTGSTGSGSTGSGSTSSSGGISYLTPPTPSGMRALTSPIYGVTVDDISNLSAIVSGNENLSKMPTTRIYFDPSEPASSYATAIADLEPHSYIMGELLDSSDETGVSTTQYQTNVSSYLSAYGNSVDIWEIGNEVNGNWTGPYSTVQTKLTDAYNLVSAAGKRSALTLYENSWASNNCGDGTSELTPQQFSSQYVPANVRDGLDYVLLSWYPTQCSGLSNVDVPVATITSEIVALHALYPNALIGFGELGLPNAVTSSTIASAEGLINYYYGLSSKIDLPYYIGGYFWWYYDEDGLPYTTKPIWTTLNSAFALY